MPWEVPVLLCFVVQAAVSVRVAISSGISHPHVIAEIGEHVGKWNMRSHEDVISRRAQHAVHKECDRLASSRRWNWSSWASMDAENVTVWCLNGMFLSRVAILSEKSNLESNKRIRKWVNFETFSAHIRLTVSNFVSSRTLSAAQIAAKPIKAKSTKIFLISLAVVVRLS